MAPTSPSNPLLLILLEFPGPEFPHIIETYVFHLSPTGGGFLDWTDLLFPTEDSPCNTWLTSINFPYSCLLSHYRYKDLRLFFLPSCPQLRHPALGPGWREGDRRSDVRFKASKQELRETEEDGDRGWTIPGATPSLYYSVMMWFCPTHVFGSWSSWSHWEPTNHQNWLPFKNPNPIQRLCSIWQYGLHILLLLLF